MTKLKAFRVPYGVQLLKFSILSCAFYIIYVKIQNFEGSYPTLSYANSLILLVYSIGNWSLEIYKWKTLTRAIKKISYHTALAQSLAAHTTAIITPNKIGEYGAKASFFKKELRKKILGVTFIGNAHQMLVTCIFGSIGIVFFKSKLFNSTTVILVVIGIMLGIVIIYYLHKTKNSFKDLTKIKKKIHIHVFFLSLFRYLIFSFQYLFMLHMFGVQDSYANLLPLIWLLYFISSCIPSFAIFDFAIKGSVALFVFAPLSISNEIIVETVFLMWVFNYTMPAIIGGIYLTRFNPNKQLDYDNIN